MNEIGKQMRTLRKYLSRRFPNAQCGDCMYGRPRIFRGKDVGHKPRSCVSSRFTIAFRHTSRISEARCRRTAVIFKPHHDVRQLYFVSLFLAFFWPSCHATRCVYNYLNLRCIFCNVVCQPEEKAHVREISFLSFIPYSQVFARQFLRIFA